MNIQDEMRSDIIDYYRAHPTEGVAYGKEHPHVRRAIQKLHYHLLSSKEYVDLALNIIADDILKDYPIEIKQMGENV